MPIELEGGGNLELEGGAGDVLLEGEAVVQSPPVTQGPYSQTVTEGETATFSVTAFGAGPFTYQWRFVGGGFVPGATGPSLSVYGRLSASGEQYECIVTDANELVSTSDAATLTVTPDEDQGTAEIDYPCALPGVLVTGNSYTSRPRTRRRNLASGPPINRTIDDGGFMAFTVEWSLGAGEVQVFREWWRWDLREGAERFNIPLMVEGAAVQGGKQTRVHTCEFDGEPAYTQNGRRWRVSAVLLAVDESVLTECDAGSLLAAYDGFCGDVAGAMAFFNELFEEAA